MNPDAAPTRPAPTDLPLVREFFPELGEPVVEKLIQLARLVLDWNTRLNLISRKDAAHIEEHHLLHSLTLTKVLRPPPAPVGGVSAHFADLGTGGGFPGLVLAICYPQCQFTLVDSVGKKIAAVSEIARDLGLRNVEARALRAETLSQKFDYVTGRAVTALPAFLGWARPLLRKPASNRVTARVAQMGESPSVAHNVKLAASPPTLESVLPEPNSGVYYFKGTLWREELAGSQPQPNSVWPLDEWIPRPFFAEKFLLHFAK